MSVFDGLLDRTRNRVLLMVDARDWVVAPLTADRIDQAFPLMQANEAALTLDEWRDLAKASLATAEQAGGVVTVQFRNYLNGLFVYRIEENFDAGRVLSVDMIRVLDIIDPAKVNRVLRQAIAATADRFGCVTIRPPLGGDALPSHAGGPSLEPCPIVWLDHRGRETKPQ
ncbi:MAG: hypothetical protein AAF414_10050 [Pseudomonadota bacterium]